MIRHYQEQASNERTYLSWVRTGLSTSVFGFVIRKFAVVSSPAGAVVTVNRVISDRQIDYLSLALIALGIGIIVLATWHFLRTKRAINDERTHDYEDITLAYILSALLTGAGIILCIVMFGMF